MLTDVNMQIETSLGRLHLDDLGRGPALLCWPSLFCDSRTLRPIADDLARDHRVLLVDGPGHGQSSVRDGAVSLEDCANAAVDVLDALGVERAVWIGAAWGGHVGILAAIQHADRFPALVTMNAPMDAWSGSRRALFWASYLLLRATGPNGRLGRAVASAQIAPAVREASPDRVETILDCMRTSERRGFMRVIRWSMLGRPSLVHRLPEVRVPTLFVTGSEDKMFPVEAARLQAAAIPDARFEVVDQTAHQSAWEAPQRVVPLLREFLSERAS